MWTIHYIILENIGYILYRLVDVMCCLKTGLCSVSADVSCKFLFYFILFLFFFAFA